MEIVHRYYDCGSEMSLVDKFGFITEDTSRTASTFKQEELKFKQFYLARVLHELLNSRAAKFWSNLSGKENLKYLVREYGVPNEKRPQLWMSFIKAKIEDHFDVSNPFILCSHLMHCIATLSAPNLDLQIAYVYHS